MRSLFLMVLFLLLMTPLSAVYSAEIQAGNVLILYDSEREIKQFNKNVRFGSFGFFFGKSSDLTTEEQVQNKVIQIFGRVQQILDMQPPNMTVSVQMMDSTDKVQQVYLNQYEKSVDFVAFYSPKTNTVYLSVDDVTLHVFAHEIAHSIIEHYFNHSPPVKMHELMAQYVEAHIED